MIDIKHSFSVNKQVSEVVLVLAVYNAGNICFVFTCNKCVKYIN